jgi:hypothetical protein
MTVVFISCFSGVVSERLQAAHRDSDAPALLLFPGTTNMYVMVNICVFKIWDLLIHVSLLHLFLLNSWIQMKWSLKASFQLKRNCRQCDIILHYILVYCHIPFLCLHMCAEGTTTNGDYLLPFKTGAFRAHTPVKPVILKYPYKRFSPAWDTISGASSRTFCISFLWMQLFIYFCLTLTQHVMRCDS